MWQVMRDPNGISRGSGFVAFSTPEEASRAVSPIILVYEWGLIYLLRTEYKRKRKHYICTFSLDIS